MKQGSISVVGERCTGCEACVQKCPNNALSMVQNGEGFFYPVLKDNFCTQCGICLRVCPAVGEQLPATAPLPETALVGTHREREILLQSSSGGAFTALVSALQPDWVYGMAWQEEFGLGLTRVAPESMAVLRKSKYIQGRISGGYQQVQADLQAQKQVLYSGTPCQVAGLIGFLGSKPSNLITVEIICHGVSSPGLFSDYCKLLERTGKSQIEQFSFRKKDSERGDWECFNTVVAFSNGKIKHSFEDPFTRLFLQRLSLRSCCGNCAYASVNRVSDVVIGDYWGCKVQHPELYNPAGVSVILPITPQGRALGEKLASFMTLAPVKIADILNQNKILIAPRANHPDRTAFFNLAGEKGLEVAMKQYTPKFSWKRKLKACLSPLLRRK